MSSENIELGNCLPNSESDTENNSHAIDRKSEVFPNINQLANIIQTAPHANTLGIGHANITDNQNVHAGTKIYVKGSVTQTIVNNCKQMASFTFDSDLKKIFFWFHIIFFERSQMHAIYRNRCESYNYNYRNCSVSD